MAAITAALVKELRERTSEGMMDCKKALVEANGDIEVAIENMRKSGAVKAAKKAGRTAAEGIIVVKSVGNTAAMVEINCETDFVARDENFVAFSNQVAELAVSEKIDSVEALNAALLDGVAVEEARQKLVTKIKENINVRRIALVSGDATVASYVHGTRIGVLVALTTENEDIARDVAMHVAASNPQVTKPEDVDQSILDKEKEIFTAQALESGKPAEIVEKMIGGRLKKFVSEISLTGQPFVKDPSITVAQLLKSANTDVINFVRFEVGEGIEKKEEDFAAEVMAQVQGK